MHTIIGVLNFGANGKEAFENSKRTMRKLVEDRIMTDQGDGFNRFDYCVLFDKENTVAAGEEYFKSEQNFIKKYKGALAKRSFIRAGYGKFRYGNIPAIIRIDSFEGKKVIETAIGEISEEEMEQRKMEAEPWCSELFDPEGVEIKSCAQLDNALLKFKDKQAFIVLADVHF